ncbi:MAG TPA: phosphoadenylyl-sulfate reductase [Bryobacteraceae bacterium]|nr:phosphoadenylyl-sulfate reductase [Bryobacteraceae bacterium]
MDLSQVEASPASEILSWAVETFGDSFAIATSFQKESMVVVDLVSRLTPHPRVFTLDTGRLPEETYHMMDTLRERYGVALELVFPDRQEVERMTLQYGPNLFLDSVERREMCCEIRKVRPLERKLKELRAWATGLRREQAETRTDVPKVEAVDGRMKISPLADWTEAQVDQYVHDHDVPLHPLYAQGYASIGCAPCTRPILPGEPQRAGRWWWEQDGKKECGIHFALDGTVRRA